MILVTTAGKVGSETARLLRERDVPVRVLVRDPAKPTARRWPRPARRSPQVTWACRRASKRR